MTLYNFRTLKEKIDRSEVELTRKSHRTPEIDHTLTEDGVFSAEIGLEEGRMRVEELQTQQTKVKVTKSTSMNDLSGSAGQFDIYFE